MGIFMKRVYKIVVSAVISLTLVSLFLPLGIFAGNNAILSCPSVIHPNEKIVVSFSGAPADGSSVYVVMTPATAPDNYEAVSKRLELIYLEGKTNGELIFEAPWTPGKYKFIMFINKDTIHVTTSSIINVEQYKAVVSAAPVNVTPGTKVNVRYSGVPTLSGAYIVIMKENSELTPAAISNERGGLVYLSTEKSSGSIDLTAPAVSGKYKFWVVINKDTIIIGTSNTVQVGLIKTTLVASPAKCNKKAKVTIKYSNVPTNKGAVYIVMMKKSSSSTESAVSNERFELKYIKSKSGKVVFTAPNKAGSYNFRIFINKGTILKGVSNTIEVV